MPRFKTAMKVLANSLVDTMPWGLRQSILEHLIQRVGEDAVFTELGTRIGIAAGCAEGACGWIQGDIRGVGVLFGYARRKVWAEGVVTPIVDFFQGRGGTYLDIGANIGLTTIPVARNPLVQCRCFEPDPLNFRYLRRNLDFNGPFSNVTAHQMALFDRSGEIEFELSTSNMGGHRVRHPKSTGGADQDYAYVTKVTAMKLDDIVSDPALPLVAKIDVEGAEPSVFAGGQQTFALADLIVFEFFPRALRRMGVDLSPMLNFLRNNFAVGAISAGESAPTHQFDPIAEIVDRLQRHYAEAENTKYWDVTVRRRV